MVVLSAFALVVAVFAVRASENEVNREVDCEPQWHVGFVGKVQNNAQTCFEYQLEYYKKYTKSSCQRQTASLNSGLSLSLSFEFPLDSQMAAKNPFVVDETVAAIKSSLTTTQPFDVVPFSDRSAIAVQLQPISVADMQLTDTGFGALTVTPLIELCTAARVPLTYGVCIVQSVFKGTDNVLELVGDSHRVAIPLPDLSSLPTQTWATRRVSLDSSTPLDVDSSFGSAVPKQKLSLDLDESMRFANAMRSPMSLLRRSQNEQLDNVRPLRRVSAELSMSDWFPEVLTSADLQSADSKQPDAGSRTESVVSFEESVQSHFWRPLDRSSEFRFAPQNEAAAATKDEFEINAVSVFSEGTDSSGKGSNSMAASETLDSAIVGDSVILPMALVRRDAIDGSQSQAVGGLSVQLSDESRASMERSLAKQLEAESKEQRWNPRGPFNSPALVSADTYVLVDAMQTLERLRAIRRAHVSGETNSHLGTVPNTEETQESERLRQSYP